MLFLVELLLIRFNLVQFFLNLLFSFLCKKILRHHQYVCAPWEENVFKPQVTVKNTGTIALKDYHAKLWFRVPEGKTLYIPADDWYTPVSNPSLKNIGENVWELDMDFDTYMLYPNESVIEGNIGLHLTDWSKFDKTVCGIALLDSEKNVIFGNIPSVGECKTYNSPSLLNVQYVWKN